MKRRPLFFQAEDHLQKLESLWSLIKPINNLSRSSILICHYPYYAFNIEKIRLHWIKWWFLHFLETIVVSYCSCVVSMIFNSQPQSNILLKREDELAVSSCSRRRDSYLLEHLLNVLCILSPLVWRVKVWDARNWTYILRSQLGAVLRYLYVTQMFVAYRLYLGQKLNKLSLLDLDSCQGL